MTMAKEAAKRALVEAWNSDGDGFKNFLPPIEFSDAELEHLVGAVLCPDHFPDAGNMIP